ncbi:MAG: class I SAM-dependent methyltransferase [Planctomycetes bacterium]|nr:class I SAM-dependent methyltransferase [Planctomycetota bacterium]
MNERATHEIYNHEADNWSRSEPTLLSDYTARPFLLKWSEPFLQGDVLDLGCGEGYVSRNLALRGCRSLTGVDMSAGMIDRAVAREEQEPLGIRYLVADARDLSVLESARYDLVLAVFLFNYLDLSGTTQVLSEVHRRLRPGGTLILSVPHPLIPFLPLPEERFGFEPQGGYFSGRDQTFEGTIARRDGMRLPVRCVHKTLQDLLGALSTAGFQSMPEVVELGVTEDHLRLDPEFFAPLYDRPLHLAIRIQKS